MWTLILSFTIAYQHQITSNSISIPNIRSKVMCEAVGKDHISKYKNDNYTWFVGVYSCVETAK